LSKAVREAVG